MITAKVHCNLKQKYTDGAGNTQATVGFCADYADGRNKEWSQYTPYLDLRMTVKGDIVDLFEPGRSYTLQFVEDE